MALPDDAREHLVTISAGDARTALNVLEAAAAMAGARPDAERPVSLLELVEAAAQQRVLAYDRAGDGHYGTVSAFIKSVRGNDPDAALYWLATMVAAGRGPEVHRAADHHRGERGRRERRPAGAPGRRRRRRRRSTGSACPKAQYALAQATVYVAIAPKSNRVGQAYWAAMADVQQHGSQPVPPHLLNAPYRRMSSHGIGVGYRYPHDYDGADVEQQDLPDMLVGRRYWHPGDQGYEPTMAARREQRLAARSAGSPQRKPGR